MEIIKERPHLNELLKTSWSRLSFSEDDLQNMVGLYEKYHFDLLAVREKQLALFGVGKSLGLVPQLCDIEAEMTYLRIRESKPAVVVEISPASGWSTSWILHALKDNGSGLLYSYDLVDDSTRVIPCELADNRWYFHQGDITQRVDLLPPFADYLFIDSDHSAEFAHWYIENVFSMYAVGTKVSVNDILKWADEPGWGKHALMLCSWLAENNIKCITASRALPDKGYLTICKAKRALGISSDIQSANYNSTIFFEI